MKTMKLTNGSKEFIAKIGKKFVHKKYGVVTVVKMVKWYLISTVLSRKVMKN